MFDCYVLWLANHLASLANHLAKWGNPLALLSAKHLGGLG